MAYSWKTIIACVVVWFTIVLLWHFGIYRLTDFQVKARLLRLGFVFILQSFLTMISIAVWKVLSPLPYALSQTQTQYLSRKSLHRHKNSDADHCKIDTLTEKRWTWWHYGLIVYIVLCHLSYLTNYLLIGTEPHWFSMLCYICLGIHLQFFVGLAMIKGIVFLFSIVKNGLSPGVFQFQSKSVLSYKYTVCALTIYIICASMMGLYTASQPPHVKQVSIPIKDLPKDLKGFRIVQLSDIHLGPTVGFSKLTMIMSIVKEEDPDLLVITGDLVDGSVESLKGASEPLRSVKPKYGKMFVTGNHEYYTGDVDNWLDFLRSMDITVLHNSNIKIPTGSSNGHQICFAGTDDLQADKIGYGQHHTFDLKKAVKGCDEHFPIVLLAHQPNAAQKALDSGTRLDLILSGHTHGGQIFPFMFGAYFLNSFFTGLYKIEGRDSHVYVSTGTQYWGIPMRIGTSMEITSITLQML